MLALLLPVALAHLPAPIAGPAHADPALRAAARAEGLPAAFSAAARQWSVPEPVLLALAFEASHWQVDAASAWGGYGLFDFREADDDTGPSLELAARLAALPPDLVRRSPAASVQAAAALLAWHGAQQNGGKAPPVHDLLGWWGAVRGFSGHHAPMRQALFADAIFDVLSRGVPLDPSTGLELLPREGLHPDDLAPAPPPTACDYGGCAGFTAASSANYSNDSRGAGDVDYIIVHTVQGSYSGCISWFQNSAAGASAHYVVRSSDGQVTQMVSEADVAWHAGNWSYNVGSVGIEHEGYVSDPGRWYTSAMYQGSAALAADIADRHGIPINRTQIIGHNEVPDPYNPGQYGGAGHHTDPGSGWDWSVYIDLINDLAGGGSLTGNLIGVVADTDIYSGTRLVGATAWIAETGETVTVDGDGYYRFTELPLGSYTVHACLDGYAEATCSKSIGAGDNWCSIALEPGSGCSLPGWGDDGGSGDGGTDTGADGGGDGAGDGSGDGADTGGGADTAPLPDDGVHHGPITGPPGEKALLDGGSGGCSTAGAALSAGWLAGALALVRRRRPRR